MIHLTLPRFRKHYAQLPSESKRLDDNNFRLLKANPDHPSFDLKKVGRRKQLWSARIGDHYWALGTDEPDGLLWFWIGTHAEYDRLSKL